MRIYRLLDELPANERLAWTLRHIEGEQVEAVASLCGCSLATAKRRIAAAQTFLARTLDDA
jgi:RNA polymerase sigma-70 factor (ECF subfamily)